MRPYVLLFAYAAACNTGREDREGDAHRRARHERTAAAVLELPQCVGLPTLADRWVRVDLGPFSVQLPPEFTRDSVQGIDSYVGKFSAPGRSLSFDHGLYSNSLAPSGGYDFQEYRACREVIGGRVARIVRARRDTVFFTGAAWRELSGPGPAAMHLTIDIWAADSTHEKEALRVVRSVRFP